jgi:hypothetical protein
VKSRQYKCDTASAFVDQRGIQKLTLRISAR